MEIWKTLIAPIFVALLAGFLLGQLQQPPVAAVRADANWIDTSNLFAALDLNKALEALDPNAKDKAAINKLIDAADNYLYVRIVSLRLTNTSKHTSKTTVISLPNGGVLYWFNENKQPQLAIRRTIDTLPPGAEVKLTAITRPTVLDSEIGVMVTHDGQMIEPSLLRAPDGFAWITTAMHEHPVAFPTLVMMALMATAMLVIAIPVSWYATSNYDRRARLTSAREARDLVKFTAHLKKNYPDKVKPPPSL